jgi:predicted transposase YbfD/YdcC
LSKKTAELIIEGGGDYFLQVKGNQKGMRKEIELKFEEAKREEEVLEVYEREEINKGRKEERKCSVLRYENKGFKGSRYAVKIEKKINGGKVEKSYYVTSIKELKGEKALNIKRKHWTVESFHYVKDVTLGEDRIKSYKLATINGVLKSLIFNVYKQSNFKNMASAKRYFKNSIKQIIELLHHFNRLSRTQ